MSSSLPFRSDTAALYTLRVLYERVVFRASEKNSRITEILLLNTPIRFIWKNSHHNRIGLLYSFKVSFETELSMTSTASSVAPLFVKASLINTLLPGKGSDAWVASSYGEKITNIGTTKGPSA